ncbi:MAG: crossover junction endodeoxyribonuclease RuvC [bacterium]|nr:MAG: crossover junction endodeoxyribonuclease RuvC [bacterium]
MSLTLGIDPGSHITGYGIVERQGRDIRYIASGIIRVGRSKSKPERLLTIKQKLDEVLQRFAPDAVAVEEIFMAKNPKSTLTLGEVRGVILVAAAGAGVPVFEYTPREVKSSVVGAGAAHKSQVAAMVSRLLKPDHEPATVDETDALAVAFCHSLRATSAAGRLP